MKRKILKSNLIIAILTLLCFASVIFAVFEYEKAIASADETATVTDYSGDFYFVAGAGGRFGSVEECNLLQFRVFLTKELYDTAINNGAGGIINLAGVAGKDNFIFNDSNIINVADANLVNGVYQMGVPVRIPQDGIFDEIQIIASLDLGNGEVITATSSARSLAYVWQANVTNGTSMDEDVKRVINNYLSVYNSTLLTLVETVSFTNLNTGYVNPTSESAIYRAPIGEEVFIGGIYGEGVFDFSSENGDIDLFFCEADPTSLLELSNHITLFYYKGYCYFKILSLSGIEEIMANSYSISFSTPTDSVSIQVATLPVEMDDYTLALESEIEELRAELDAKTAEMQTLEAEVTDLLTKKAELEAEVTELEAEIATLSKSLLDAEENVAELEAEVETLSAEVASCQSTIDTLEADILEKQKTITELQYEIESSNGDLYALWQNVKAEKEALEKELEEEKAKNALLESQLDDSGDGVNISGGCDSSFNAVGLTLLSVVGIALILRKVRYGKQK